MAAVGTAVAAATVVPGLARAAPAGPAVPAVEILPGLSIFPRDVWGAQLPPVGPIATETPQFFLVHHTASSNSYTSAVSLIQATYAFHTSSAKGWSDVCYEFFIGRDGDVWEGRAGALTGPVVADATGGSQGFAQLICLLGDFTAQLPTPAAMTVARQRPGLARSAGTRSTSRRMPRRRSCRGARSGGRPGTVVTTHTISGHRDMSYTECPGDALYPLLPDIRAAAVAQMAVWKPLLKPARRLGLVNP